MVLKDQLVASTINKELYSYFNEKQYWYKFIRATDLTPSQQHLLINYRVRQLDLRCMHPICAWPLWVEKFEILESEFDERNVVLMIHYRCDHGHQDMYESIQIVKDFSKEIKVKTKAVPL